MSDLAEWWRRQAEIEIERTVPKAIEYSSYDLIDIGRQLARFGRQTVTEAEAAELGVAFYLHGKVARIMGALAEGQSPSDDSWFDVGVYARMAQRIRENGAWPGE